MSVTLEIVWDGEAPGLSEHRLSLGTFSTPLARLLTAFRRIGSGIASDALGDPEYGSRGGKYAKGAEALDLQLRSISDGCVTLSIDCTAGMPPGQTSFFEQDLPGLVTEAFLDAVASEARGELRSSPVRSFLRSLPASVRVQRYTSIRNGIRGRTVSVGEMTLADAPEEVPFLMQIEGDVVGVLFEGSRQDVRLKSEKGVIIASATPKQVELAIRLRNVPVRALLVSGPKTRLLWLRALSDPLPVLTPELRRKYIFERWDETMRRLAQ